MEKKVSCLGQVFSLYLVELLYSVMGLRITQLLSQLEQDYQILLAQ